MGKQFFDIGGNNKGNKRNNIIRDSTKSHSLSGGDFSRRPPHTPPKGNKTSSNGKKNK